MGLLENMRAGTDSTFMQVVLGLVVVSFVFWYANPQGDKSGKVAEVNGTAITTTDYERQFRMYAGGARTQEEEARLGALVTQQLIEDEVLSQEAHRLGIEVSDKAVAQRILADPRFFGNDGVFDDDIYSQYIRRLGYTRPDYEEFRREQLLREKLQVLVLFGATVSEPVVLDHFVRTRTEVVIDYVRLLPAQFLDAVEITDEELAVWIEENGDLIQDEYEAAFDLEYDIPEKVRLRGVRLDILTDGIGVADLLPRMRRVEQQLDSGADLARLAAKVTDDPRAALMGGDLGLQSVEQLSPELVEAVAGLEVGERTQVIITDDALHLYRLEERVDARVVPLEDVQEDIARRVIRAQRAPGLAANLAEEILAGWTGVSAPPQELLDRGGLIVTSTGHVSLSEGLPDGPPLAMLEAASDVPAGQVLPEVFENGGALYVGKVTERQEPDMAQYELDHERIREEALMVRRKDLFQSWLTDLVARSSVERYR